MLPVAGAGSTRLQSAVGLSVVGGGVRHRLWLRRRSARGSSRETPGHSSVRAHRRLQSGRLSL